MKVDFYVIRDLDELGFQLYLILLYYLLDQSVHAKYGVFKGSGWYYYGECRQGCSSEEAYLWIVFL